MANEINYAKEYSAAIAEGYSNNLNFADLWKNDNTKKYKLDTMNANTIYIPKITLTGGLEDGDRDSIGTFSRKQTVSYETKTLRNHKTWNTLVHPMDVVETNDVATIQNATEKHIKDEVYPYLDKLILSTIFTDSKTALSDSNVKSSDLTVENVLTIFDELMDVMDDGLVPQSGRVLYVPTKVKTLIDNANAVYRVSGNKVLGRAISRIDDVEVKSVPTPIMTVGEQKISMFLVHPSLILPVQRYEFSGIEAPSVHSQGKSLYFEEFFTDAFILNDKAIGAQFVIPATV